MSSKLKKKEKKTLLLLQVYHLTSELKIVKRVKIICTAHQKSLQYKKKVNRNKKKKFKSSITSKIDAAHLPDIKNVKGGEKLKKSIMYISQAPQLWCKRFSRSSVREAA